MKALLTVLFCAYAIISSAKTVFVNPSQNIQAAIDMATPGDTIMVKPGVYKPGNLKIAKRLMFLGIDLPTFDAEDKYELFTVTAEDVVIDGFRIINTGVSSMEDYAAIKGNASHRIQVLNNVVEKAFFGIHLSNTFGAVIRNNTIDGEGTEDETMNGNGIHLWKCTKALIENNSISGHRDGIYFEFVTQSTVTRNHSQKNIRYGLHFMFSHEDKYISNEFVNNGAGVAVMYTRNVTMKHNLFAHNWGPSAYGLLLKDIRDSEVENNRFEENTIGIYMEGTSRTKFLSNDFKKNGYALRLQASCDDNNFNENNFSSNTFDVATNGSLVLNKFETNYWDKYDGYDLDKDGYGDVSYHPVNLYSMIVERVPSAVLLWRSFMVFLLDRAEKTLPALTPENLVDTKPRMNPFQRNVSNISMLNHDVK